MSREKRAFPVLLGDEERARLDSLSVKTGAPRAAIVWRLLRRASVEQVLEIDSAEGEQHGDHERGRKGAAARRQGWRKGVRRCQTES